MFSTFNVISSQKLLL